MTRIVSPCLVYWHCHNPNLRSHGTVAICSKQYPARQTIHLKTHCLLSFLTQGNKGMDEICRLISSRKAYRSHMTCLLKKVEEITGNGTVSTSEEPHLSTLITSVEQLESKSSTLTELDTQIAEHTSDPEELENEILRAVEIHNSISECTGLPKRMIDRSEWPQPPTVSLLNVDAIPYQPFQTTPTPATLEEHQEPDVKIITLLFHQQPPMLRTLLQNMRTFKNPAQIHRIYLLTSLPNSQCVCPN